MEAQYLDVKVFNLSPEDTLKETDDDPGQRLEYFYGLVGNIPPNFRSSDLRNYFSAFVEENKIDCFHFRHRPQIVNINMMETVEISKAALCSLVRFSEESFLSSFLKKYHGKFWMDKVGNELQGRCVVQKVRLSSEELIKFTKELRPPRFMPTGNVGTSNSHFLNLIRECVLPPSLIKRLNLEFPRARSYKKYSKVPFNYGTCVEKERSSKDWHEELVCTAKGHLISSTSISSRVYSVNSVNENDVRKPKEPGPARVDNDENESDPNEDRDLCEEWERYEALNNDVTSQERLKERLYEEEIELVWEKGGPGIVWYTDAQYWDAQRGNFDERTADDFDVDMEGYYVPGGGDKDARDMLEMRQSDRFRMGLDENISVFKHPTPQPRQRLRSRSPSASSSHSSRKYKKANTIGEFERYTRGFGRKLMEKQGWKDGIGLGTAKNKGIPEALESEGQTPRDKRGFGFYGEKIEWSTKRKRPKYSHSSNPYGLNEDDRVIIGTVYDKPNDLDKDEPLHRSNAPSFIKRY